MSTGTIYDGVHLPFRHGFLPVGAPARASLAGGRQVAGGVTALLGSR